MNITTLNTDTSFGAHVPNKRRPALACKQCRRRKVKCDRRTPCGPCTKATIKDCLYVCDGKQTVKTAPFEAHDTQFSVFQQNPVPFVPTPTFTPTATVPSAPVEAQSSAANTVDFTNIPEEAWLRITSALSPTVPALPLDLQLANVLDKHSGPAEPKSPLADLFPTTSASLRGAFSKRRYYGPSHWINFAHHFPEVQAVMQAHEANESNHGCVTFARCKAVSKPIKAEGSTRDVQHLGSLTDLIPTRALSDRLVQAYLRTFQTVFGILHVPSFCENYKAFWTEGGSEFASETFGIILLLVMCIGSSFCLHDTGISRTTTLQWIEAAAVLLSSPTTGPSLSLDSLRIQCLFWLAHRAKSVNSEMACLTMGSLPRTAMRMGLHIDPEDPAFSQQQWSPSDIESRRRLWATILELKVQYSMDLGSVPSIDGDDYNCALPSNIDDATLEASRSSPGNAAVPPLKPRDQFTQSSLQILLMQTLPIRFKIATFINRLKSENSFEKALDLSAELTAALKRCSALMEAYCMSSTPPTAFQRKIFHLLVQRFLLSLHHPFARKAMSNPLYYYSRKVCLETSLSLSLHSAQVSDDDFHQLCLSGSGLFHDVYTQSALYMCSELTDQCEADRASFHTVNPGSNFDRKEMRRAIVKYLELAATRIAAGGRKIKAYILVSCLLAQADAMQTGAPVEQRIAVALTDGLEMCYSILRSRIQDMPPTIVAPVGGHLDWSQWIDSMDPDLTARSPHPSLIGLTQRDM